jgi:hypothetical protein
MNLVQRKLIWLVTHCFKPSVKNRFNRLLINLVG